MKTTVALLIFSITFSSMLTSIGAFFACIYWIHKVKKEVIDKDFDGKWKNYLKHLVNGIWKKKK